MIIPIRKSNKISSIIKRIVEYVPCNEVKRTSSLKWSQRTISDVSETKSLSSINLQLNLPQLSNVFTTTKLNICAYSKEWKQNQHQTTI